MKSQLRQDLVSGDWIVVAPGRAKRPHNLLNYVKRKKAPKSGCPFEDPQKSGHEKPILVYGDAKNWQIQVLKNKYPLLTHKNICPVPLKMGPYLVEEAGGHHDLIITRDHNKNFLTLYKNEARQLFEVFRDRYLTLLNDKCLAYVLILHNWGPRAGASPGSSRARRRPSRRGGRSAADRDSGPRDAAPRRRPRRSRGRSRAPTPADRTRPPRP